MGTIGRYGGLAGVCAGALGVGTGEATAALLPGESSPVLAVGDRIIDLTPLAVKNWAIAVFGTADKPVLLVSVVAGLVLLLGVAGLLGTRRVRYGVAGFLVLAAVDGILVGTGRTSGSPLVDLVPVLVVAVVGCAALVALLRVVPGAATAAAAPTGFDRRRFLLTAFAVGGVGAAGGGLAQLVGPGPTGRAGVALPAAASPAPGLPAGAELGVPGLTRHLTGNDDFYRIDIALRPPRVDVRTWRLPIIGMVDEPIELTYADLVAMPLVERRVTLACVSNPVGGEYVGNAAWLGVPFGRLLDRVGMDPGADAVLSRGADGMVIGTPLSALTDGRDAMLAVGMNGEPLPIEHGFPVRMVVPGLYGFVSATKWLTGLEVTRFDDFTAYWSSRGWAERAPVKTATRIDLPDDETAAGPVTVGGVAWAQHRGIARVEVRVDGGPWQAARLAAEDSPDTWRQWTFDWGAEPGEHTITARATDGHGETQASARTSPAPDGATGWPSVTVTVR